MKKFVPSKWKFLFLLIMLCMILLVFQIGLYLLAYVDLFTLFGGIIVLLLGIPLSYAIRYVQIRYQHSKAIKLTNKIAFILAGAFLAPAIVLFTVAFIALAMGWVLTNYIGSWGTLIIMYVVAPIIGASITYLIGKRRDFRSHV